MQVVYGRTWWFTGIVWFMWAVEWLQWRVQRALIQALLVSAPSLPLLVLTFAADHVNKTDSVKLLLVFLSGVPHMQRAVCRTWQSSMDPRKVAELKGFVQLCESNPMILHLPEMSFFRTWLLRSVHRGVTLLLQHVSELHKLSGCYV